MCKLLPAVALVVLAVPSAAWAQPDAQKPAEPPALPSANPEVVPSATPAGVPEQPAAPDTNVPVAQAAGPTPEDHARIDNSPAAHDGHPLAGFHGGIFFLRDHHDNFNLYVGGRLQLDFYSYMGAGVPETPLKPTLFIRRLRPEISGEILGHWRFMLAGDFGTTAIDNPRGTNQTLASAPGTVPTGTSARFAAADSPRVSAAITDGFINYRQGSLFNVQIGQYDAPFMLENRTSDKYIPFMERSLAVRAVGIPTNKEIGAMFWGETKDKFVFYSFGPFMGDGQNRTNVDSRFDVMGRAFVHPLANAEMEKGNPLKDLQVGGSFRYGSRDKSWVDYDYSGMSTQGAYTFWSPTYGGANGNTHVIPSGDQMAFAGELRVPVSRFDLTGELVYIKNNTREAIEGFQATNSERFGEMKGISYYAQLGYWATGKRDINGAQGYENPGKLDWSKEDPVEPARALQLLVKWEQIMLSYASASRGGAPDTRNIDGDIKVNAVSLGMNYWATKHVRLTLNYVYNMFPDSAPFRATAPGAPQQTSANRAMAPGNTIGTGINDRGRDNAQDLHEILARFAIAL